MDKQYVYIQSKQEPETSSNLKGNFSILEETSKLISILKEK